MDITLNEIKHKITKLAEQHKQTGDDIEDWEDSELIELQAEKLITDYCVAKGYQINGFPHEKMKLPIEDLEEDYFCRERYQLYLDSLAVQKEDVAEIMWWYVSNFWKNQYKDLEDYIHALKDNLESGFFYEISID